MNILIDIGHPAHVHLFRNAAEQLRQKGHSISFTIRDKPIIRDLLASYGFEYTVASAPRTSSIGQVFELLQHDWHVLRKVLSANINVMLGSSVSISHVSRVTRARSIVFAEDDADYIQAFSRLTYPFCDTIVIPDCLRDRRTRKHVANSSYHELAYLHPDNFEPDRTVLVDLGVDEHERFFLVRNVAMKAYHDRHQSGMSRETIASIVELLASRGRVFVSTEGELPQEYEEYGLRIPPDRMHHAMHFATMLVSDSQTMTMEAGVLGTPAIRCNSFADKCSVITELEERYGLVYSFRLGESDRMTAKVSELLDMPGLRDEWQKRRASMLEDKVDFAKWITDFVESY